MKFFSNLSDFMANNCIDFGDQVVSEIIIDENRWVAVISSLFTGNPFNDAALNAGLIEEAFVLHTQFGDVTITKSRVPDHNHAVQPN